MRETLPDDVHPCLSSNTLGGMLGSGFCSCAADAAKNETPRTKGRHSLKIIAHSPARFGDGPESGLFHCGNAMSPKRQVHADFSLQTWLLSIAGVELGDAHGGCILPAKPPVREIIFPTHGPCILADVRRILETIEEILGQDRQQACRVPASPEKTRMK